MTEVIEHLRKVPFFSDLKDMDIQDLATQVVQKTYPRDNLILLAEDEGDTLFVIIDGKVKVSILSEDGREVILAILGPGEFFGELSLLDGLPRSATVIASEDAQLLTLRRPDFLRVLDRRPEVGVKVLAALIARLRKNDRKIESLALMDVSGRVANALLQICEEVGEEVDDGVMIRNRPTHQEIANMAGTTRETVSRVMKRLEQHEYIAVREKHLIVVREADLRNDYSLVV